MVPWLHPTLVHFAVALVVAAVLFDVLGLWRQSEKLLFAGFWNTVAGAGAAVLAVASGWLAELNQELIHDGAGAVLAFHKTFALAGAGLWLVVTVWRVAMRGYIRPRLRTPYLAASFLVVALITVAGILGGTLVYGYGVGVSPSAARRLVELQDEANGFDETPAVPRPAQAGEPVQPTIAPEE